MNKKSSNKKIGDEKNEISRADFEVWKAIFEEAMKDPEFKITANRDMEIAIKNKKI